MHSTILLGGLVAILPALAEELRTADVPTACETICGPIVTLTNTCDVDPNETDTDNDKRRKLRLRETAEDDEAIEADCICKNTSFDVASVMALCASCISQNGATTDDADKIMKQCSFSPISYTPSATTAVQGVQVQATKPATATGGSSTSTDKSAAGRLVVPVAAVVGISCAALMAL